MNGMSVHDSRWRYSISPHATNQARKKHVRCTKKYLQSHDDRLPLWARTTLDATCALAMLGLGASLQCWRASQAKTKPVAILGKVRCAIYTALYMEER
jgi:hypothetical protein